VIWYVQTHYTTITYSTWLTDKREAWINYNTKFIKYKFHTNSTHFTKHCNTVTCKLLLKVHIVNHFSFIERTKKVDSLSYSSLYCHSYYNTAWLITVPSWSLILERNWTLSTIQIVSLLLIVTIIGSGSDDPDCIWVTFCQVKQVSSMKKIIQTWPRWIMWA